MVADVDPALALVQAFLRAFNARDAAGVAAFLDEGATLFAPGPAGPDGDGRVTGPGAVAAHFAAVLAAEPPGGPDVRPRDLAITPLDDGAALATFRFDRAGGSTGRRTLVLRRHATAGWRIVHVHASNT